MRFIDTAVVHVQGGNGGAGVVHWRREAHVPRGGPDGGNGGDGGAVIFVASTKRNTLIEFTYQRRIRAGDGQHGDGALKDGRTGADYICDVPIGTQVYYKDELVADLAVDGARWVAAPGGNGGKGNTHFKSATNQSPDYAQPGQPGAGYELKLVLKSIADIGLIGFPNAGKSTLISVISAAKPKIADYEFTTLEPNLGVVRLDEHHSYVVADIPGIIPGAHEGKGLGVRFLKHIERTKALAQLIDPVRSEASDDEDYRINLLEQFNAIEQELALYDEALAARPRLVIVTKADLPVAARAHEILSEELKSRGFKVLLASSASGEGIPEVKNSLYELTQYVDRSSS